MRRDLGKFYKSISEELKSTQDRIRHLIGDAHWLSDGEHKETILRKTLRNHLPENLRVSHGFVSYEEGTSTQIDILIHSTDKPTLYKEGELVVVTSEAVKAIIEVKTVVNMEEYKKAIKRLSNNVDSVREEGSSECMAGLFVYGKGNNDYCKEDQVGKYLEYLKEVSNGNKKKAINLISIGKHLFMRFGCEKYADDEYARRNEVSGWNAYRIENLSYAYFISNLVYVLTRGIINAAHLFPIVGGKEPYKISGISL